MDWLADCPTRLAFDLVANTWNPVVVWALRHGPRRHGELRRTIGGISAKVLTETLRRLEFDGLVERREGAYALTPLGETLLEPIEGFGRWAADHGDDVLAARDRARSA
ncbi:helix-turn-helix domain-containing protein [Amycolatopsis sp., V23-08]|uniref:Helix-turn-helix domain-containing protein n=1 Tax=Amycolatopsis heterodermiae TaxID=3110235 RepID=A0ABU5R7N0_9PSEU|nr:helix-turn-helix domain-containing protein [Amycolatopsis sp., V23-08]MEA5362227.1 helix-turn-helix domain-containing protein [Amycolatopsis sp., V23-08]